MQKPRDRSRILSKVCRTEFLLTVPSRFPSFHRMLNSRLVELLIECTARIGSAGHGGTGFFVSPHTLLTCAHVVRGRQRNDLIGITWATRPLSATVAEVLDDLDLAVLTVDFDSHPCVLLSTGWDLDAPVFGYGYPVRDGTVRGDSIKPDLEGETHPDPNRRDRGLLKLAHTQVEPGFSGAPLLDRSQGAVIGIVKSTRNRNSDLGGRAIPWSVAAASLPRLAKANRAFHERDLRWRTAAAIQHLDVASELTAGGAQYPTGYSARIRRFIASYVGTPDEPEPFGGRSEALAMLSKWLESESAPPYFLITAPAGRGKSALLVQWCRSLLEETVALPGSSRPSPSNTARHVVFLPISIRYQTNLAAVAFAALAARLAEIHHEPGPKIVGNSADEWRGFAARYLERACDDGATIVLVIDGLDEAADWHPGPDLFPFPPPLGLKVLVSARLTERRPTVGHWMGVLGWERGGIAQSYLLPPLTSDGLSDVLVRMGVPLDVLGYRPEIVDELFRLTDGDPLLLNLYVKDLWKQGSAVTRLTPEDLRNIRPGFQGYFERWWEDQRELWRKQFGNQAPLREEGTRVLLKLLACALGPLRRKDLLRLGRQGGALEQLTFADAMLPLERFIVRDGDGDGFVFAHPKLADYQYAELVDADEHREWETRFTEWGESVVSELRDGVLEPHNAPPYLVLYHGAHLDRLHAPASLYVDLLCRGWVKAWFVLDSTYSGFLSDVDRVWRRFAADDDVQDVPAKLSLEFLCALIHSSITTLAQQIPPLLLAKLVEEGIHTDDQAEAYANRILERHTRASAVTRIASAVPASKKPASFRNALGAILEAPSEHRAALLLEWIKSAPENVLLSSLPVMTGSGEFQDCLASLAERLPVAELPQLVGFLVDVWNQDTQSKILAVVATRAEDEHLGHVISAAGSFVEPIARSRLLREIASRVTQNTFTQWFSGVCQLVEANSPVPLRHIGGLLGESTFQGVFVGSDIVEIANELNDFIRNLCPQLLTHFPTVPEGTVPDPYIVAASLCLARRAPNAAKLLVRNVQGTLDPILECDVCSLMAHVADASLIPQLFHQINVSRTVNARARAFCNLAVTEGSWRAMRSALRAVVHLPVATERVKALAYLALAGPERFRERLWRRTSAAAAAEPSDATRALLLYEIAATIPVAYLRDCVTAAESIREPARCMAVFAMIASRATVDLHLDLLTKANDSAYEQGASEIIALLAPRLSSECFEVALEVAGGLNELRYRVRALSALAGSVPKALVNRVLRFAYSMPSRYQVRILAVLARRTPADELEDVAGRVVNSLLHARGKTIEDIRALAFLAPYLSSSDLLTVLAMGGGSLGELPREVVIAATRSVPREHLGKVLRVVGYLTTPTDWWAAIRTLASRMPPSAFAKYISGYSEKWAAGFWDYKRPSHPATTASALLSRVDREALPSFLLETFDLAHPVLRAGVLWECATRGPVWLLPTVLRHSEYIQSEEMRCRLLVALAPRYPESNDDQVVLASLRLQQPALQVEVLEARAIRLPREQRRALWVRALAASQKITDQKNVLATIRNIALPCNSVERETLFSAAFHLCEALESKEVVGEFLVNMAPIAPFAVWTRIFSLARLLTPPMRAEVLMVLFSRLSPTAKHALLWSFLRQEREVPQQRQDGLEELERELISHVLEPDLRPHMLESVTGLAADIGPAIGDILSTLGEIGDLVLKERILLRCIETNDDDLLDQVELALGTVADPSAQANLRKALSDAREKLQEAALPAEQIEEVSTSPTAEYTATVELQSILHGMSRSQQGERGRWEAALELLPKVCRGREAVPIVKLFASGVPTYLLAETLAEVRQLEPWCKTEALLCLVQRDFGGTGRYSDGPDLPDWDEVFSVSAECGDSPEALELRRQIVVAMLDKVDSQFLESLASRDVEGLRAVAPFLPLSQRTSLFEARWAEAIKKISPHEPAESLELGFERFREEHGLGILLPDVESSALDAALLQLADESGFAISVAVPVLYPYLSTEQRLRALDTLSKVSTPYLLQRSLDYVVSAASSAEFHALRRLCLSEQNGEWRARLAEGLIAQCLRWHAFRDAVELIDTCAAKGDARPEWTDFIGSLDTAPQDVQLAGWRALLKVLSRNLRETFLSQAADLVLAGARTERGGSATDFGQAIIHASEWWS